MPRFSVKQVNLFQGEYYMVWRACLQFKICAATLSVSVQRHVAGLRA